jgi:hypothetical protein
VGQKEGPRRNCRTHSIGVVSFHSNYSYKAAVTITAFLFIQFVASKKVCFSATTKFYDGYIIY